MKLQKTIRYQQIFYAFISVAFVGCQAPKPIEITPENYHASVDKVTEIMIHDIFSPPVASRIFAYPNVAAYEILVQKDSVYKTLSSTLNGLSPIPTVEKETKINLNLAAIIAHLEMSKKLIFSENKFEVLQDSLYTHWQHTNKTEFEHSKKYALRVVKHIKKWMDI